MSRKALEEQISRLGPTEHREIFRILLKHRISFTQNNNGTFVNISNIPDSIVDEISKFVTFCTRNNKELDEYDKMLHQCKLYQKIQTKTSELGGGTGTGDPVPLAAFNQQATTETNLLSEETCDTRKIKCDDKKPDESSPCALPPYHHRMRARKSMSSDPNRKSTGYNSKTKGDSVVDIDSIMKWMELMDKTPDPVVGRRTIPYASAKYTCARKKYSKKQYNVSNGPNGQTAATPDTPGIGQEDTIELLPEPYIYS